MTIKATIWDFSGVLIQPVIPDPFKQLACELGIPPDSLTKYFDGTENGRMDRGKESERAYLHRMKQELGLKENAIQVLGNFFFEKFKLDADLITFIRQSRSKLKTALCSNFSDRLRPSLDVPWKVTDAFDVIIISCEVGYIKPERQIYQMTLEKLAIQSSEAIFVDDNQKNIEGARAMGINAILFNCTSQTIAEINSFCES